MLPLHLQQRAGARAPVKAAASSSPSPPSPPPSKARATAKPQPQRRSAKDPSQFPSYDAIRAHLHRDSNSSGFISGLLNGLSDRAFGYGGKGGLGAALYRAFVRFGGPGGSLARPDNNNDNDSSLINTSNAQPTEQSDALAALLMISRTRAAALARHHPLLLAVPPAELGRRVLALKSALPGCDVAALVEARPDLYLLEEGGEAARGAAAEAEPRQQQQTDPPPLPAAATAGRALAALREGLPGADADMVAFEDPALLFHPYDKLRRGLRRLRALWPSADEQALAASEPRHLALAVRALGEGQGDDDEGAEDDEEEEEGGRRIRQGDE